MIKLGRLIEGEARRDAIHIAVAPVTASCRLYPGDHIGLVNGMATTKGKHIGVVDPFLKERINEGDKFYIFLYQDSVKDICHHWFHEDFDVVSDFNADIIDRDLVIEQAKKAIADIAKYIGEPFETYDKLMAHIEECISDDSVFTDYGSERMRDAWYDNAGEFWKNYKIITGQDKPEDPLTPFSCSC